MTNRVTNAERQRIYDRAGELVHLDGETQVKDRASIEQQIAREFGISPDRARNAVAHAAMAKRAEQVKWRKRRKPRTRRKWSFRHDDGPSLAVWRKRRNPRSKRRRI